jgi:hypothetical protein
MRHRIGGITLALVLAMPGVAAVCAEGKAIPKDAADVIRSTLDAADKKALSSLRALMVDAFTWSFGGDEDANQAIAEWKKDPKYLREMVGVLKMGCHLESATQIECTGRGGMTFRAGFIKSGQGWRMNYFVEGD